ncbi:MAG: M23 family metallopeptidase [Polyangiaceae bacterium]|nr:M23 family metallopeptidase [Polyangiaceae bacterium]
MDPLAKAAALCATLAALSAAAERGSLPRAVSPQASETGGVDDALSSACPAGTLPDGNACVPVPEQAAGAEELSAEQNTHRDRLGRWVVYEQIPRRPERPADYRAYRYPVPLRDGQRFVSSGYDLHLPSASQRRGAHLKAVGHGGIDISQARGTEVRIVDLEHQVGDAEVVLSGELFGNSVVTRHAVREGGQLREYLVIYGHLDGQAPGLRAGMNLREGSLVGFVGDSGSPGDVHLHLEVRRVRDGVAVKGLAPRQLVHNARTVVCDPRNVLPLLNATRTP